MLKSPLDNQIITCLLGDPVEHSVSDIMFGHFAKMTGIDNYTHFKFKVPKQDPNNLKIAMRALSIFEIAGANITLPYKEKVIQHLYAVDKTAEQIRAVNTIVNKNGKLIGYNTDGYGNIKAIEGRLRPIKSTDRIVIFGAGGAARAIIGGLPKVDQITVLNRISDFDRLRRLKRDFAQYGIKIETKHLTNENIISTIRKADFIINATPVGMYPNNNISLLHKSHLSEVERDTEVKNKGFFDAVFNPFETEFLKIAKRYNAGICPGIYMMIYQGLQAFKLWTGKTVPQNKVEDIRELLYKRIQTAYEK